MELHHLRSFVAVAELLSFRHAAERLHLSRPPLTRQIQRLEEELGVLLLLRDGRRAVCLTDAGHAFLLQARQALRHVAAAAEGARQAAAGRGGVLRLGGCEAHSATALNTFLPRFRRRYPAVEVAFQALTGAEELRALRQGTVHLSLSANFGEELDPAFATRTVATLPLQVVLPARHVLARRRGDRVELSALEGEVFLSAAAANTPPYVEGLDAAWKETGRPPRRVRTVDGQKTVLALVVAGYGVAVLPGDALGAPVPGCRIKRLGSNLGTYQLRMIWLREHSSRVLRNFLAVATAPTKRKTPHREIEI